MTFAYKIETALTGPEVHPAPPAPILSESEFDAPRLFQSQFSNSTSVADTSMISGSKLGPLLATPKLDFNIPSRTMPDRGRPAAASTRWSPEQAQTLFWYAAALRRTAPLSSATRPILDAILTAPSEDRYRTNNLFPLFIVAVGVQALALKQANDLLASAREAARANDMRTAYGKVFRGLDILLRSAQWKHIGSELEEMSSELYPAEFGIGAVRFASDAASRIPRWNLILNRLTTTAKKQNVDVAKAMRGLLRTYEAS
jgi:hypothetical protein